MNLMRSISNDINTLLVGESSSSKALNGATKTLAASQALMLPVMANNAAAASKSFFKQITDALEGIYSGMSGAVHIIAAVMLSIALLVKLFSKNPRSIDEANQWAKNIILTWLAFNFIGAIVQLVSGIKSTNYDQPWNA